jgi:hypothetical protein
LRVSLPNSLGFSLANRSDWLNENHYRHWGHVRQSQWGHVRKNFENKKESHRIDGSFPATLTVVSVGNKQRVELPFF